jgi:hypothetical protein
MTRYALWFTEIDKETFEAVDAAKYINVEAYPSAG